MSLAFSTQAFDLQGHRGARGLAPENTLPAFERAMEIGVSTLELDVGVTADGVVVVSHDPALNPLLTRDESGLWLAQARGPLIKSLTLAQLQRYDVGRIRPATSYAKAFAGQQPQDRTPIPTLASVFALAKQRGAAHLRFNIETKILAGQPEDTVGPCAMVAALLQTVREAGVEARVTIQSFDWRTLQQVQQLAPSIATAYLSGHSEAAGIIGNGSWTAGLALADRGSVPRRVKAAGGTVWSPSAVALSQALVDEAHSLGLQVIPWTINDPATMHRLIGWGVDGMITDYPDRLREVMRQHGLPLPPSVKS